MVECTHKPVQKMAPEAISERSLEVAGGNRILVAGVYGEVACSESRHDTRGDAPARTACSLPSDGVRCITAMPDCAGQGLDLQI